MNQQVTISPTRLNLSTTQTDVNAFKRVLLSIIITLSYIEAYNADERKIKVQPTENGKRASTKRIRNVTGLRERVGKFNSNVRHPVEGKESREKGSSDSVFKLNYGLLPKKSALIDCYNQITAAPLSDNLYGGVAHLLSKNVDANLASYVDCINSFVYCQHLLYEAFDFFDPFDYQLVSKKPDSKPNISVDEFIDKGRKLSQCIIDFRQDAPMPLSAFPELPATGEAKEVLEPASPSKAEVTDAPANTGQQPTMADQPKFSVQEINASTETEPSENTERCVGHHLNYDRELVLADTTLTWRGQKLVKVVMEQRYPFRNRAHKYTFVAEADYIIDGGKSIYVVLQAQTATDLQMQITIERTADESGQRNGVFSYLKHKNAQTTPVPAVPVSGLVVLQTVPDDLNIEEFEQQLDTISDSIADDTIDADQIRLRNALRIRYRLLDQVIVQPKLLTKSEATPWTNLQTYVGRYVCYYMRLSKNPAKFEISQVQIFPDGRATLRQPPDEQVFEGYVRVNGDRLWIFFRPNTYEEPTGKDTIRFIVDKGTSDGQLVFRGMFSSQTMTEKRLVSGRMLMKLLPHNNDWPSIEPVECQNVNFTHIPREDDRKFFMEEWKPETNLTDGPIWAEVSRRLQGRSALEKLNKLCTDLHSNEKPFTNNRFYYYTFKADPANKTQFVIERNLVEFQPNGKVKIYLSPGKYYEGYAYYDKNTLRLALSYAKSGFLELFLELDDDDSTLSEIKILYGMSLWHSSKRLQGKMVVLSRYGDTPDQEEAEQYKFTNDAELAKLEAENLRGGGVMSYIRGELNRYMHATTDSSHQQFRPRDQSFRQLHFLVACYYGYRLQPKWGYRAHTKSVEKALLKSCTDHLEQAFYHGYACSFAGMNLNYTKVMAEDTDFVEQEYVRHFLSHLSIDEQDTTIRDLRTVETLKRIRQIAEEQDFLNKTFQDKGPLDRDDLRNYARRYWKDLVPPNQTPPQTLPIPFDNQPTGPDA